MRISQDCLLIERKCADKSGINSPSMWKDVLCYWARQKSPSLKQGRIVLCSLHNGANSCCRRNSMCDLKSWQRGRKDLSSHPFDNRCHSPVQQEGPMASKVCTRYGFGAMMVSYWAGIQLSVNSGPSALSFLQESKLSEEEFLLSTFTFEERKKLT